MSEGLRLTAQKKKDSIFPDKDANRITDIQRQFPACQARLLTRSAGSVDNFARLDLSFQLNLLSDKPSPSKVHHAAAKIYHTVRVQAKSCLAEQDLIPACYLGQCMSVRVCTISRYMIGCI